MARARLHKSPKCKCVRPVLEPLEDRLAPTAVTGAATTASWNIASGHRKCAEKPHYRFPNAPQYDCVTNLIVANSEVYTAAGLKAAHSNHPGGVNVALADGSVRFISNTIDLDIWRALSTPPGGEIPGPLD